MKSMKFLLLVMLSISASAQEAPLIMGSPAITLNQGKITIHESVKSQFNWTESADKNSQQAWTKNGTYAVDVKAKDKKPEMVTLAQKVRTQGGTYTQAEHKTYKANKMENNTSCEVRPALANKGGPKQKDILECWQINKRVCDKMQNSLIPKVGNPLIDALVGNSDVNTAQNCVGFMDTMLRMHGDSFAQLTEERKSPEFARGVEKVKTLLGEKLNIGSDTYEVKPTTMDVNSITQARNMLNVYFQARQSCEEMWEIDLGAPAFSAPQQSPTPAPRPAPPEQKNPQPKSGSGSGYAI